MKVFNMIKGINEWRALAKYISCECRGEFDGRKCNLKQKWNINKCQCEGKKPIKITYLKRIMPGILVHVFASVRSVTILWDWWLVERMWMNENSS